MVKELSKFQTSLEELNAVPFGSRKWGGYRTYSDFDYAISLSAYEKLKSKYLDLVFSDTHSIYKVHEMFNVKNIIVMTDGKKYNLIVYATQEMVDQYKKMNVIASKLGKDVFEKKISRVKFCEAFDFLLLKPIFEELEELDAIDAIDEICRRS